MSDRRTREQHCRKFQELINSENQNVSEAIPLAAEEEVTISPAAKVEATISPATEAKEIITPPSATTIPSAAEAKATTTY